MQEQNVQQHYSEFNKEQHLLITDKSFLVFNNEFGIYKKK